jgi:hypothetical protein
MSYLHHRTTYCILFVLFGISVNYAQIIKGTVSDDKGQAIGAKILIKSPTNPETISEFILVSQKEFNYTLKKSYSTTGFILEVGATGYTTYEELIVPSELKKTLEFNFVLNKEKIIQLEEVNVASEIKPYYIKKDTVVFKVESYKDGNEKKVEDLLKNLPGIEVKENGSIKYKGKTIETVTIEGDNLFDYNYSIGTRNISIDLVEEIEAIENYSENSLLKGIENSDKVSLNLKLKDNKVDITGDTNIGVGDFAESKKMPLNLALNLLGINKIYKSFAVSTYNTIGENSSPFNYSSNQINLEQLREDNYYTKQIIPELSLKQVTNDNLSNINNQFFSNYNSVFTLSKKLKAKVNLYYISDKINSNQFSKGNFLINNETFTTFDNNSIQKKPLQYRGDLELKYNTSKSSLLEYDISFRDESIKTDNSIFSNQTTNDYSSFLKSKNVFLKQTLEYTKKISDKKALQILLLNTASDLNQGFDLNPSFFNNPNFIKDVQNITSKKLNTNFTTLLLGRGNKNNKYSISAGFNLNLESMTSDLFSKNNTQTITVDSSSNDLKFKTNEFFTNGTYNWRIGKFSISPKYTFRYLNQELEQTENSLDLEPFIFEPALDITYKLNRTSLLQFNYGLNKNTQSINNLFVNQILIDNRNVINNTPNISLQKNENYGLLFSKNDLFNQLDLSIGGNYLKQKGNYFNNIEINENTTRITNFFLPEANENLSFYLNFSKLIPSLKTNVKITSNYSILNFKNIVNNSDLRTNKSYFSSNSLFLKTSFNSLFNFENKSIYTVQEINSQTSFTNKSLENNFKLIIKPSKQIYGTISYNYFVPNLRDKSNNYTFLNTKLSYKPKNKDWQLDFNAINLLNENIFNERNTTDISTNIFRVNLLSRYCLLNFSYTF